jgi:hypothetical protein
MTVHPITSSLVRVDGWRQERFAVLTRHGWCWDVTGRAVCPLTAASIERALRRAQPATVAL